jgi:hypothetical protein
VTLRIRPAQKQAFENAAEAEANSQLALYARNRFAAEFSSTSDEILLSFVAEVRESAMQHEITEMSDIATAIDLTVMYGQDFYEAEWVRDVFGIQEWDGAQRMEVLRQRLRRQLPEF